MNEWVIIICVALICLTVIIISAINAAIKIDKHKPFYDLAKRYERHQKELDYQTSELTKNVNENHRLIKALQEQLKQEKLKDE